MPTEPITAPDHLRVHITAFLSKISRWQISGKTWGDKSAKFGCTGLTNSLNSNENNIWYLLENYAKGLFIMHTVRITIGWKG